MWLQLEWYVPTGFDRVTCPSFQSIRYLLWWKLYSRPIASFIQPNVISTTCSGMHSFQVLHPLFRKKLCKASCDVICSAQPPPNPVRNLLNWDCPPPKFMIIIIDCKAVTKTVMTGICGNQLTEVDIGYIPMIISSFEQKLWFDPRLVWRMVGWL